MCVCNSAIEAAEPLHREGSIAGHHRKRRRLRKALNRAARVDIGTTLGFALMSLQRDGR